MIMVIDLISENVRMDEKAKREIAALYKQGESTHGIAFMYGLSHQGVSYILKRMGVPIRKSPNFVGKTVKGFKVLRKNKNYNYLCKCLKCGHEKIFITSEVKHGRLTCSICNREIKYKSITSQVIKMYNSGMSLMRIAAELYDKGLIRKSISNMTIRKILMDNNIKRKSRGRPKGAAR